MTNFNKIVFADFVREDLPSDLWAQIDSLAALSVMAPRPSPAFDAAISDADGLIVKAGSPVTADDILIARELRYVGAWSTGFNKIDISAATAKNVVVTNVPGYSTDSVAELAVLLTVASLRHAFSEYDRASGRKEGATELRARVTDTTQDGRNLNGRTVGIVGLGHIGARTAEIMRSGYGARVFYWNRTSREGVQGTTRIATIDELVETCDVISLHLSSNDETNGIITRDRLTRMQPQTVLVNTAPNELVDLDAVTEFCASGRLFYAMDHPDELYPNQQNLLLKLLETPNVVSLPPIGYATQEATRRKQEILVENLQAYVVGRPKNVVN